MPTNSELRILLIEDHEDTAYAVSQILKSFGYHNVTLAFTIAQALETLVNDPFDLILSDVSLPDGTGIKLIHSIRSFCKTPAVALTGYAEPEDARRCLQAGFNRHLAKPLNFSALLQTIQELTELPSSVESELVAA